MKKREHSCPKCDIGELFDANAGGMFCSQIECDNPDCDFDNTASDMCGCVTA